jgi:hypothetical protein
MSRMEIHPLLSTTSTNEGTSDHLVIQESRRDQLFFAIYDYGEAISFDMKYWVASN